jgi:general secretion pathway protein J
VTVHDPVTARSRERGFTLLELLIAITLLGLIMTMAFSGFRLGTRAWERADAYDHEVYLVQQLIRQRLGAAYVASDLAFGSGDSPLFDGGSDYVRFVAPLPDLFGPGGLYWVTLGIAGPPGESDLVMWWRLYRPDGDATPGDGGDDGESERRVLLGGIVDASFAYLAPAERQGAGPRWRDAWHEPHQAPRLVRIELVHPHRSWPVLYVAQMLASSEE